MVILGVLLVLLPILLPVQVQPVAHLARADPGVHQELAVADLLDLRVGVAVVLVVNVADDLLQDILDRQDPGGAAIFVEDKREVALARPHLAEEQIDLLRFRHDQVAVDRAGEIGQ